MTVREETAPNDGGPGLEETGAADRQGNRQPAQTTATDNVPRGESADNGTTLKEAALDYARRGWLVFPVYGVDDDGHCLCGKADCASPGKHPMTKRGLHDATDDTDRIARFWDQHPDANIGICTGPASGIWVVDIDVKDHGPLRWGKLLQDHGEGDSTTPHAQTGSGGMHVIFAWADGVKNSAGKLAPSVDVRGADGYIVAPPSRHASGGAYRWLRHADEPPADAPDWLLELARAETAGGQGGGKRFAFDGEVAEGSRNDMLYRAACSMRAQGWAESAIRDAVHKQNHAACDPPLPDKEVNQIVKQALKQPEGEPAHLRLQTDKHGVPYANQHNCRAALRRLGVHLSYDEFAGRMLVSGLADEGPALDDKAVKRLWLMVDREFGFRPGKDLFWSVVEDEAHNHKFHPVCNYLDGLTWDGTPRLDGWLVDYGGAEDTEYTRAVGAIVLIAAVRRVRQPGCKFDEMLVLESPQGTNKSSALAALAVEEDWFSDDLPLGADGKRVIEALAGRWIVEAGELRGMRNADVEHLKALLSRRVDRARMSYDRFTSEVPRQCVIVGTTNSERYLRDQTGNRRFWPVKVAGFDLAALHRDRNQLWAEAAHREAQGESIRLPKRLWPAAAEAQERREVEDPFLDKLQEKLGNVEGKIRTACVWNLVGVPRERATQEHNRRIGDAMRQLGWTRTKKRFGGPQAEKCYVKPENAAHPRELEAVPGEDGQEYELEGADDQDAWNW